MRDLFVTIVVFGALPIVFKRPYWGAVLWIWISVMNPHAQGWGFARSFPFAALIAATTLVSLVITKEDKKLPMPPVIVLFILFFFWMSLTAITGLHPEINYDQWNKVLKIWFMTLVVLALLKKREHITAIIWSIVISIGYYGVKGGVFTIRSGATERVWGPAGTFIDGNNEVALAFVMVIPLMYYLMTLTKQRYYRIAFMVSMVLCALSALGSYSRGAMLAVVAMGAFLWLKSKEKVTVGLSLILITPVLLAAMPAKWFERMDTINEYKEDESAMGRVNAWKMAINLAQDRPLGGGFQIYDYLTFQKYAPVPEDVHAAHSIYFQVLGEHGFIGLAIYLAIGFLTWRTCSAVIKLTKLEPDLKWAFNLSLMIQVSLLGFAVGGAFLSLAYFDVPYYLMVAIVATKLVVERELAPAAKIVKPVAPIGGRARKETV
ncbi:MAG: putative O-glycosylation ligase, exosortase A system-associated [Massilia sp.]